MLSKIHHLCDLDSHLTEPTDAYNGNGFSRAGTVAAKRVEQCDARTHNRPCVLQWKRRRNDNGKIFVHNKFAGVAAQRVSAHGKSFGPPGRVFISRVVVRANLRQGNFVDYLGPARRQRERLLCAFLRTCDAHFCSSPRRQPAHRPQLSTIQPTPTWSPTLTLVTASPTAVHTPANSCPGTQGYCCKPRAATWPAAKCKSVWQMPQYFISSSTSFGLSARR
jgi:hypothetical protein